MFLLVSTHLGGLEKRAVKRCSSSSSSNSSSARVKPVASLIYSALLQVMLMLLYDSLNLVISEVNLWIVTEL